MSGAAPASRGGSWRPILLLVLVAPLLLGLVMLLRAGGGLRVVPAMDWSPYPASVHAAVETPLTASAFRGRYALPSDPRRPFGTPEGPSACREGPDLPGH